MFDPTEPEISVLNPIVSQPSDVITHVVPNEGKDDSGCGILSWPVLYLGIHLGGNPSSPTFWDL